MDKLHSIMDALAVPREDREQWMEAAHLAHAPSEVRSLVRRLRLQATKDSIELDEIRVKFSAILAHLRAKGIDLPKGLGDG